MVLEYIEGQSLRTSLKQRGPLPVDEVVAIGLQRTEGARLPVERQRHSASDSRSATEARDPGGRVSLPRDY
jgi:hypothetical protein